MTSNAHTLTDTQTASLKGRDLFFHSSKIVGDGQIDAVEMFGFLAASEPSEDRDRHMANVKGLVGYLNYSNEDHDVLSSAWSFLGWPMPKAAELTGDVDAFGSIPRGGSGYGVYGPAGWVVADVPKHWAYKAVALLNACATREAQAAEAHRITAAVCAA